MTEILKFRNPSRAYGVKHAIVNHYRKFVDIDASPRVKLQNGLELAVENVHPSILDSILARIPAKEYKRIKNYAS